MKLPLQHYAQLAAVVVVAFGCWQVLHPFVPALLFAAVACAASWPLYARIRQAMGGRSAWAALVMTLGLVVLVVGPSAGLALSLADDVTALVESIKGLLDQGPLPPPDWLQQLPLVGEPLTAYWQRVAASREEVAGLLKTLMEPARAIVVGAGRAVGASLLQLAFATFIAYFFYRDGDALVVAARRILARLAGPLGDELMSTIHNTVTGVVHGIFGTALAQAIVAMIGFVVAGVPGVVALGAATFVLSMVPIGPPLVWGGAALWLAYQGSVGWAVFMVLWGLLAVSSIDNFIKPYLISRSSSLPLLLIMFGVFGGIIAFGFIGIFIGPPMLAVGLTLVQLWTAQPASARADAGSLP
jgi:predicted PurR-regulated permease PerM